MNNLMVMEAANIFVGDDDPTASNHLSVTSLKLPGLEEAFSDHTPGGARVGIEIDTHVNRLEAGFNLAGWAPQVMTKFNRWSQFDQVFTARGVIRDRHSGVKSAGVAVMRGRLGRVNPTEFRRADVHSHEYSIRGITRYKLTLGEDILYEWDFFNNIFLVGGVDVTAEDNSILGVTSFTGFQQALGGQQQV